jgi:hypothetical protein
MKPLGIVMLCFGIVVALGLAACVDTSVAVGSSGERVENAGAIARKHDAILIACAVAICGAALAGSSGGSSSGSHPTAPYDLRPTRRAESKTEDFLDRL